VLVVGGVVGHDWGGAAAGARPLPISLPCSCPHGGVRFDWRGDADVPLDEANSESVVVAPEQLAFVNASVRCNAQHEFDRESVCSHAGNSGAPIGQAAQDARMHRRAVKDRCG
jgi:hypothetical protein